MSQTPKVGYRHALSVDIIALSNPALHDDEQRKKIEVLNQCLQDCEAYKNAQKESMKLNTTGDGFVIGVYIDPIFPIELALQLQEKLNQYNQGVDELHKIKIRMGIHSGISSPVSGFGDEWGEAFIGSTRVMSIGEGDHILLSAKTASDLVHFSTRYEEMLHPIGEYEVKHGVKYSVYSAYGNGFGNSTTPQKKSPQEIEILSETSVKNEKTEERQLKTHVISISVKTDRFLYPLKSKVFVRTKLNDIISGKTIDIEVYNSSHNLLLIRKINPSTFSNSELKSAGIYETEFTMKGSEWKTGEHYKVIAKHGNAESQISFMVDMLKPVLTTNKAVSTYHEEIRLAVVDPSQNRDSTKVESAGNRLDSFVTIEDSLGKIRGYKLIETGKSTGIFEGILRIVPPYELKNGKYVKSHTKGHGPYDGVIPAHRGEQIHFRYSNDSEQASLEGYVSNFGATVNLDSLHYRVGDIATITVVAPDYNIDPKKVDIIGNKPDNKITISTSLGKITNYRLMETEKDTGIFTGYIRLKTRDSKNRKFSSKMKNKKEKGPKNGIIYAKETDEITVTFETDVGTFKDSAKIVTSYHYTQNSDMLSPLQRISVTDLGISDNENKAIKKIKAYQSVKINALITNNQNKEQPYAFLIQIQDQNGQTIGPILSSQGVLSPLQPSKQTLSWIPHLPGKFIIQVFVWESINRPSALCAPMTLEVSVT
ncbi:MAG: hypothetical protein KGI19_09565 [Thaumarchaeota archaeon]|nr:hypothetical protein [Nitrososphaerota archaeon]